MSEAALTVGAREPATQPSAPPWPLAARVGFRFLVSYFGRKGSVTLSSPDADHVIVDGNIATQRLSLRLKRRTTLPLFLSRGFHFVNEFPFNR